MFRRDAPCRTAGAIHAHFRHAVVILSSRCRRDGQVVPHVTDALQEWILDVSKKPVDQSEEKVKFSPGKALPVLPACTWLAPSLAPQGEPVATQVTVDWGYAPASHTP